MQGRRGSPDPWQVGEWQGQLGSRLRVVEPVAPELQTCDLRGCHDLALNVPFVPAHKAVVADRWFGLSIPAQIQYPARERGEVPCLSLRYD